MITSVECESYSSLLGKVSTRVWGENNA